MLKFLSKRKRSRNAFLILFVILLTAGLIGFFSISIIQKTSFFGGVSSADATIAKVVGNRVTVKEYKDELAKFARQLSQGQGQDPANVAQLYGKAALDQLIRSKLIDYEAERLNLEATDEEVQTRLKSLFSPNPWPGYERYRTIVQQQGSTVEQFEDSLRASITEEKLKNYVAAAAQVSEQDVEDDYRQADTNYNVRWVEVGPEKLRDKVKTTDAELQAYYDQHKQDFRINLEERRAKYIFIDQNKAGESIQVSDDELRSSFNPEAGIQQVRVSEIVVNIASTENNKTITDEKAKADAKAKAEEEAKAKADDLVGRARGESGAAEDFAKLARQSSDDAKSKAAGGDIGWVNKKDNRNTDDPLARVFSMKQDEVSPPIRKGDKYYILKVTERKVPAFEESKAQLLKEARTTKGYSKAVAIADEAAKKFRENKNADAVVAEINKQYGEQVASVKETSFFAEGDKVPGIGDAIDFTTDLFQLHEIGDVGERQNITNGFAIPQYIEKKDPHDSSFDEVKSKVEDRVKSEKAKDMAAEQAKRLAASAQNPDALKSAAESMGFKVDERTGAGGTDSIGPLVTEADRAIVHKLNPGEITKEPIKAANSDTYVVVGLMSRKDPDMGEKYKKDKRGIEDRLLQNKRDTLFSTFLATMEKRLKDEGKIIIYDDVFQAASAGAVPGTQRPGLPPMPGRGGRPRRMPPPPR
ncbi:MAG: hypothetical protein DMF61_07645 [Blastocatellia bacterium AA13]|nr:MAG: hypothetical protein DMF61_07645 [Blastocatellia bacterium AA13]